MQLSEFLKKYYNSAKFILVHKTNLLLFQDWISLDSLELKTDLDTKCNPNTMFDEYYLSEEPIKVQEQNGKYCVIDGHHRIYRGLFLGYNYFLTENSVFYKPCTENTLNQDSHIFKVYRQRPQDHKKYSKIDIFDSKSEEKLKQFEQIIINFGFRHPKFQRYEEDIQSKI